MKRTWIAVAGVVFILGGAALHAESTATLTIEPSEMKEGETKSFTDDGRTITVTREGNSTHVRIDGADKTGKLTITREGNRLRIGRTDADGLRTFVVDPDQFPRFRSMPERKASTFFVCPKDRTMLRVPDAKGDESYKCPVDGTTMEKRKGRGFTFFFDDEMFESNIL